MAAIITIWAKLCVWYTVGAGSVCGLIGKVLLANADALCAAATPLVDSEHVNLWVMYSICHTYVLSTVTCPVLSCVVTSDGKNRFESIQIDAPYWIDSTSESNTGIFDSVVIEYVMLPANSNTYQYKVVRPVCLAYVCSQKSHLSLQSAQIESNRIGHWIELNRFLLWRITHH